MKASQLRDCSLKMTDYRNSFEQTASFENSIVLHLDSGCQASSYDSLDKQYWQFYFNNIDPVIDQNQKTKHSATSLYGSRDWPNCSGEGIKKEQKTEGHMYGEAGIQFSTLEAAFIIDN